MKKSLKISLLVLLSLVVLIALTVVAFVNLAPQIGSAATGPRLKRMQASPNYKEGKFQNLVETSIAMSFGKTVNVSWEMLSKGAINEPKDTIQTAPFDAKRFEGTGQPDEVAVSWFGHSSVLIRIQGKTLLTDPVFGERPSMVSFFGPKRFPFDHHIRLEDLPKLDAVILSHDHYDHLDYETFLQLKGKVSRFFVPLGVGVHLEKWGISPEHITELDWWETARLDDLKLVCTPARHFSGRGLTNRNTTLWSSWVLQGTQRRVYYGGDSGYYSGFKTIGDKYGPFDIALLECGAYNQDWISIHMMPEQTAQAQLDVKGKLLIPIHWGKFNLALHTWTDPIERLTRKAAQLGTAVATPRIGELTVLGGPVPATRWWEAYR
ncbi:MAG: MBL fold metallo-hydrolase [Cytophagaceae bacterium]|nr:MBL fold metallo-hydrolase [Cytophagaceae bacterium]